MGKEKPIRNSQLLLANSQMMLGRGLIPSGSDIANMGRKKGMTGILMIQANIPLKYLRMCHNSL